MTAVSDEGFNVRTRSWPQDQQNGVVRYKIGHKFIAMFLRGAKVEKMMQGPCICVCVGWLFSHVP